MKIEKIEKMCKSGGNTSPQISQSKYWCFTYHKGSLEYLETQFKDKFSEHIKFYIFAQEFGKSGDTPHLQGYIESHEVLRPSEFKLDKKIHWEKRRGDRHDNVVYIHKVEGLNPIEINYNKKISTSSVPIVSAILKDFESNRDRHLIKTLDEANLYNWENDILSIVGEEPHPRKIYWYWSEAGNTGKSTFTKYLAVKYKAIVVSGNASDMKFAVLEYKKKNKKYPEIIVCDVARNTNIDKLCYSGFEEVKNGCFFSGKYESGMVLGNCPHFIIFANSEPNYSKMSVDRWDVTNLDNPNFEVNFG